MRAGVRKLPSIVGGKQIILSWLREPSPFCRGVGAFAFVGCPQTLLFVADDTLVPPCDDARGADDVTQIIAGLRRRALVGWLGIQLVGDPSVHRVAVAIR